MKKRQLNALKTEFVRNLVDELMQLRTYGLDLMKYQGDSKQINCLQQGIHTGSPLRGRMSSILGYKWLQNAP